MKYACQCSNHILRNNYLKEHVHIYELSGTYHTNTSSIGDNAIMKWHGNKYFTNNDLTKETDSDCNQISIPGTLVVLLMY